MKHFIGNKQSHNISTHSTGLDRSLNAVGTMPWISLSVCFIKKTIVDAAVLTAGNWWCYNVLDLLFNYLRPASLHLPCYSAVQWGIACAGNADLQCKVLHYKSLCPFYHSSVSNNVTYFYLKAENETHPEKQRSLFVLLMNAREHFPETVRNRHHHLLFTEHTHTHPFNGPLSRTAWVSWYQKGKTNVDFTEARDSEWQWHQLSHMQVCISLQTDNHASTPPLSFLQAGCPSCRPTNSIKALNTEHTFWKLQHLTV